MRGQTDRRKHILEIMEYHNEPMGISEISYEMDITAPCVFYHLGKLLRAGKVGKIRKGKESKYVLATGGTTGVEGDIGVRISSMLSDKALRAEDISCNLGIGVGSVGLHMKKLMDDGVVGSVHNGRDLLFYRIYKNG
jgi:predicted transcriptional regulator